MKFKVTELEMLDFPYFGGLNQMILHILKQKGAPINGTFFLEIDPNYSVIRKEEFRGGFEFTFEKVIT